MPNRMGKNLSQYCQGKEQENSNSSCRKTLLIYKNHGFRKRHVTKPMRNIQFLTAVWLSASICWLSVHHMSPSELVWTRFSHVGDATTSSAHSKKVRRSFLSGWAAFGQAADLYLWLMMERSLFNPGPGIRDHPRRWEKLHKCMFVKKNARA